MKLWQVVTIVLCMAVLAYSQPAQAEVSVTTDVSAVTGSPGSTFAITWTSEQAAAATSPAHNFVWMAAVPDGIEFISGEAQRPAWTLTIEPAWITYTENGQPRESWSNTVDVRVTEGVVPIDPPIPDAAGRLMMKATAVRIPPGMALVCAITFLIL